MSEEKLNQYQYLIISRDIEKVIEKDTEKDTEKLKKIESDIALLQKELNINNQTEIKFIKKQETLDWNLLNKSALQQ